MILNHWNGVKEPYSLQDMSMNGLNDRYEKLMSSPTFLKSKNRSI